ncbi:MAG: hypothetical protein KAV00_08505, partial [Phycisphaerae bacterium]|nr:hypothetical protein [Phycisphaerae bacterium]
MSRATILIMGLMLVGLIVSPALAQTTVTFKDQHAPPIEQPDPTISNYSYAIQYQQGRSGYWRCLEGHYDCYDSGGTCYAPDDLDDYSYGFMLEYRDMFGTATDTYEGSYVGQIPHGAVINSAGLTLLRTNYGDTVTEMGAFPMLDPDNLGHWGVHDPDNPDHFQGNGVWYGAGWDYRDTIAPYPYVQWTNAGGTVMDVLGTSQDLKTFLGQEGIQSDTWQVDISVQEWADCLHKRQGWMITGHVPDDTDGGGTFFGGELFCGDNELWVRPYLEVTFTPSLGGDANKGGVVNVGDLGVLAG